MKTTGKMAARPREKTLATMLAGLEYRRDSLDAQIDEVREELLKLLKQQGVRSVRLDNGDMFVRAERANLTVRNEAQARQFAESHNALKIDTAKVLKIIKPMLQRPPFFSVGYTEFLRITRKSKKEINSEQVDGDS